MTPVDLRPDESRSRIDDGDSVSRRELVTSAFTSGEVPESG